MISWRYLSDKLSLEKHAEDLWLFMVRYSSGDVDYIKSRWQIWRELIYRLKSRCCRRPFLLCDYKQATGKALRGRIDQNNQ